MKITISFQKIEHVCDVDATLVGLYKAATLLSTLGGVRRLSITCEEGPYFCMPVGYDLPMEFLVDFFQNVKE